MHEGSLLMCTGVHEADNDIQAGTGSPGGRSPETRPELRRWKSSARLAWWRSHPEQMPPPLQSHTVLSIKVSSQIGVWLFPPYWGTQLIPHSPSACSSRTSMQHKTHEMPFMKAVAMN